MLQVLEVLQILGEKQQMKKVVVRKVLIISSAQKLGKVACFSELSRQTLRIDNKEGKFTTKEGTYA